MGSELAAEANRVDTVRAFNRLYTPVMGLLDEGLLETRHPLTEARLLFELGQQEAVELGALRAALDIDAGYLSRIVARLESAGLLVRERSAEDGRRQVVSLTEAGRREFETLDERSAAEVRALLSRLSEDDQRRLVGAMAMIRRLLLEPADSAPAFVLRPPAAGDYGWIVSSHGALYAEEYGWDESFAALVARIVADYIDDRDARRDAAWIAEVDGERAGCVMCVGQSERIAKLRLLLVEPRARGMGVGTHLVEECIRFVRRTGYRELTLWTNDVLREARRIYERAGFELVEEQGHRSFGRALVGQTWRLELTAPGKRP